MGIVELDATACYDRILKSVVMMALMCFSMNAISMKWFFHFLDTVKYKITINGKKSYETYVTDTDNQGVGQESTGAGGTWTANDTLITEIYREKSYPAIMASPTNNMIIKKGSAVLVDDRTLYTNGD